MFYLLIDSVYEIIVMLMPEYVLGRSDFWSGG